MIRILDAPSAIARRGFPCGLTAEVPLRLEDPWLEGCADSFCLHLVGGRAELRTEASGASRKATNLGPNGLAALYAGTPMPTLRRAGLAHGGTPGQDALLDAAFAAHPYLLDSF
jgi:hypothetical protein